MPLAQILTTYFSIAFPSVAAFALGVTVAVKPPAVSFAVRATVAAVNAVFAFVTVTVKSTTSKLSVPLVKTYFTFTGAVNAVAASKSTSSAVTLYPAKSPVIRSAAAASIAPFTVSASTVSFAANSTSNPVKASIAAFSAADAATVTVPVAVIGSAVSVSFN